MSATILLKQTTARRNTDLVRSVPHYLTIVGIVLMLGIAWLLAGNTVSSEADSSAMAPLFALSAKQKAARKPKARRIRFLRS